VIFGNLFEEGCRKTIKDCTDIPLLFSLSEFIISVVTIEFGTYLLLRRNLSIRKLSFVKAHFADAKITVWCVGAKSEKLRYLKWY
jgi:hypothetical protein